MTKNIDLDYEDAAIEPFFDATQEMLSGLAVNFRLTQLNNTTLRVPAGSGHDQVSLSIQGKYRFITANVDRVHPGGAAGNYDVFATASDNDFSTLPGSDSTVYAFALAIVPAGNNPTGVALYRKVGSIEWDGAKITRVKPAIGNTLREWYDVFPYTPIGPAQNTVDTGVGFAWLPVFRVPILAPNHLVDFVGVVGDVFNTGTVRYTVLRKPLAGAEANLHADYVNQDIAVGVEYQRFATVVPLASLDRLRVKTAIAAGAPHNPSINLVVRHTLLAP